MLGRVRVGVRDATKRGATANGHDGRGTRGSVHQHIAITDAGDGGITRIAKRDRSVHHQYVVAIVLFHGMFTRGLCRVTRGGLECVMVVQRDGIEDQPLDGR